MIPGTVVYLKHGKTHMKYVAPALVDGYSVLQDVTGKLGVFPDFGYERYATREQLAEDVVDTYEWYCSHEDPSDLKRRAFLKQAIIDALKEESGRRV